MRSTWQGLVKPKKLESDPKTQTDSHTTFEAEPFERGFGATIGNSLRRHLISSIVGSAVVAVRFEGIHHEFSTIDGVIEDVAEIILNIKQLVIRMDSDEDATMTLSAGGKGEVTAVQIEAPPQIEILNPEKKLATMTDGKASLSIEMTVRKGRGYSPAEANSDPDWDLSVIPIDAVFSPVRKVTFRVEQTRVEQSSDYDKLIMDVDTDGSVKPVDAIAQAAKNLKDHLQIFINFDEEQEPAAQKINEDKLHVAVHLRKSVEELELSVRSYNCLKNAEIKTIYELVTKSDQEMLKTRNFGRKSLNEIKEILTEMGLSLGMNVDQYKEELDMIDRGQVSAS